MKSVKPGRGPSMLGGAVSVVVAVVGVVWTASAVQMGAGWEMGAFGLAFIAIAAFNAIYNFKNAAGKQRYSEFDIVDEAEEPDPLNERFGSRREEQGEDGAFGEFCPYCGQAVEGDYRYCNRCGKQLPKK